MKEAVSFLIDIARFVKANPQAISEARELFEIVKDLVAEINAAKSSTAA